MLCQGFGEGALSFLPSCPFAFLPCLWLAEVFNASWGAISTAVITVLGLVWLLGRYLYMRDYVRDPTTRTRGFAIQAAATAILFILAAVGAVIEIFSQ